MAAETGNGALRARPKARQYHSTKCAVRHAAPFAPLLYFMAMTHAPDRTVVALRRRCEKTL
jgi:hypothetical protein